MGCGTSSPAAALQPSLPKGTPSEQQPQPAPPSDGQGQGARLPGPPQSAPAVFAVDVSDIPANAVLLLCAAAADQAEGRALSRALQAAIQHPVHLVCCPPGPGPSGAARGADRSQQGGSDEGHDTLAGGSAKGTGGSSAEEGARGAAPRTISSVQASSAGARSGTPCQWPAEAVRRCSCVVTYMTRALLGSGAAVQLLTAAAEAGLRLFLVNHLSYFPAQEEQPHALQATGIFSELAVPYLPQYVDTAAAKLAEALELGVPLLEARKASRRGALASAPPDQRASATYVYPHLTLGGFSHRVFISYKRSTGSGMAGRVYQAIKHEQKTFLDSEANFKNVEELRGLVERSHTFILVLTPGYLESFWCMEELKAACNSGKHIIALHDLGFELPALDSHTWPEHGLAPVSGCDGKQLRQVLHDLWPSCLAYAPEFFPECIAAVKAALGVTDTRIQDLLEAVVPCSFPFGSSRGAFDVYLPHRGLSCKQLAPFVDELQEVQRRMPHLRVGSLFLERNALDGGSCIELLLRLWSSPLPLPAATSPLPLPAATSPLPLPAATSPLPVPAATSPLPAPTSSSPLPPPTASAGVSPSGSGQSLHAAAALTMTALDLSHNPLGSHSATETSASSSGGGVGADPASGSELGRRLSQLFGLRSGSLVSVNLSGTRLSDADIAGLAVGLGRCGALESLNLGGNSCGDAGAVALARVAAPAWGRLLALQLGFTDATASTASYGELMAALQRHCGRLSTLGLNRLPLGPKGVAVLGEWVADPACPLVAVNASLAFNDVEEVKALIDGLSRNRSIKDLAITGASGRGDDAVGDIHECSESRDGEMKLARVLAAGLSHTSTLQHFTFNGTDVGNGGTALVLKAMLSASKAAGRQPQGWERLKLALFELDEDGAQKALASLVKDGGLRALTLCDSQGNNPDGPFPGMKRLAAAIAASKDLTRLELQCASVVDEDVKALCKALSSSAAAAAAAAAVGAVGGGGGREFGSLQHLSLEGSNLSTAGLAQLATALRRVEPDGSATGQLQLRSLILSGCGLRLLTANQMCYCMVCLDEWLSDAHPEPEDQPDAPGRTLGRLLTQSGFRWSAYSCAVASEAGALLDGLRASQACSALIAAAAEGKDQRSKAEHALGRWQVLRDALTEAEGYWALCRAVACCPSLEELDLGGNTLLQDEAAVGLAAAYEARATAAAATAATATAAPSGTAAKAAAAMATANPTGQPCPPCGLRSLCLSDCGMRAAGLAACTRLLLRCPSLQRLDMSGNSLLDADTDSDAERVHVSIDLPSGGALVVGTTCTGGPEDTFRPLLPAQVQAASNAFLEAVVATAWGQLQELCLSPQDLDKLGPALARTYSTRGSGAWTLNAINGHPVNCVLTSALQGCKPFSMAKSAKPSRESDVSDEQADDELGESINLLRLFPTAVWQHVRDTTLHGDGADEEEGSEEEEEEGDDCEEEGD